MEEFVDIGTKMGLEGKQLVEFVEKREALVREEAKEREKYEREERNKEREIKKQALELEHEKEQNKLKLQLAEKEIELAKINADKKVDPKLASCEIKAKLPKLPSFCDGKDNMDAYLKRFERFAKNAKWPAEEWATNLSTLLQGKALEVYSRLSSDDANDYDKLRDALLKRYQLTEEGFRQKFRNSKQEIGETAGQFVIRLSNYLARWMELGKVKATFEGLRDLILREQFLSVSNKSLVLFLKERKIKSADEMVELAEQYMEAHTVSDTHFRPSPGNKTDSYKSDFMRRPVNSIPSLEGKGQVREYKERHCYGCGKTDHFIKSCPVKAARNSVSTKAAVLEVQEGEEETGFEVSRSDAATDEKNTVATCIVTSVTDSGMFTSNISIELETKVNCASWVPVESTSEQIGCTLKTLQSDKMPVMKGFIGNVEISVLRDSGCNSAIVKKSVVDEEQLTGNSVICTLADGTKRKFPVAEIRVDTPYYTGKVEALCMPEPVYDLVLGNLEGVRSPENPDVDWTHQEEGKNSSTVKINAVETRNQKAMKNQKNTLVVPSAINQYSFNDLVRLQAEDASLDFIRTQADKGDVKMSKDGSTVRYVQKRGLYYREFKKGDTVGRVYSQLVIPSKLRVEVLKIAHDGIMAGHLGIRKTIDRILNDFFWPQVRKDVQQYCKTCDICQKTVPKGKVSHLPLGKMPLIETPFSRIATDIVGPINPPSDNGNRFILTVVDYATRYPEAKALKRIDTESVAEALVEIYSRVGIPREVLTDQGKQFTSDIMKEVGRLLSIRQLTTTPYHPACNGLVERFKGTLKSMLRKLCEEKPRQWDRYIPALLFAYRETVQESTGFSPFQVLYGRQVRGPLSILKQLWTKELEDGKVKTTYQYVVDLRERLEETIQLVQDELEKSSKRYKHYADSKAKDRQFQQGDEVLLLLPSESNKLIMQWQGPFKIVEKMNPLDYKVRIKGKVKTYHGNMLKKYFRRQIESEETGESTVLSCVSVIEPETDAGDTGKTDYNAGTELHFPVYLAKETVCDIKVSPDLDKDKSDEIQSLLEKYPDVFTDIPGTTDIVEHDILLTTDRPIRSKPYPAPFSLKNDIKKEINNMLDLGIIEPSNSPYSSPVVLVKKHDGSYRFCCDFRKLNSITVFDAEPIGNPDDLFVKMANSKYFTKIDLSKGYWQVNMKSSSKAFTAFVTSEGLFCFKKMPFGLVNSGATFCRMMRKLLYGLTNTDNFVDDIIVHTDTWKSHIDALKALLQRLRDAKLTARPTKCVIAVRSVSFLGHVIGDGMIQPQPEKVNSILNCQRPTTKKQVRSFLGLIGYYRNFIAHFSTVSAPLSDLTKKGQPNKVRWQDAQENAFVALIQKLGRSPILCLPNFEKEFLLRTDASESGIGAVLLQEQGEYKLPIAYASKKLLDREKRYSTIEKECYAIVWGVQKFKCYLYGKEFILETDHRPLVYLNTAKVANARLMRWALALQPYKYRIEGIKGADNVCADFLSRST